MVSLRTNLSYKPERRISIWSPFIQVLAVICMLFSGSALAGFSDLVPPDSSFRQSWTIEPLAVSDNAAYFQAFQSSQRFLYDSLGWGWPTVKQTQESNEDTMRFHVEQHQAGQAYSFALRESQHLRLRGAIFVNPIQSRLGLPGFSPNQYQAEVTFWLNEAGQSDEHVNDLITDIQDWLVNEWGITQALLPIATSNRFAHTQFELHEVNLVNTDSNTNELLYSFRAQ